MILGIDVSTSKIGYCVVDTQQNLKEVNFLKFKDGTLEERAQQFSLGELRRLKHTYNITHIRIEAPFTMFSGGKTTAGTMSKLQRFNGMISVLAYTVFNLQPELVQSRSARSKCGIKLKRGENTK